jgi:DNA-directed RNA polymerase specialized sigma24 family protein
VKETFAPPSRAEGQVTALYQAPAVGLVRLAMLMLGNQSSAEDVVQEAFFGLYRRWDKISDPDLAVAYVRSSVLNGCRDVLRRQSRKIPAALFEPDAPSAEAHVLLAEEHREALFGVITGGHLTPLPALVVGAVSFESAQDQPGGIAF